MGIPLTLYDVCTHKGPSMISAGFTLPCVRPFLYRRNRRRSSMTDEGGESGFVSPLTFVAFLGVMLALIVIITQTTEWGEENQELLFGDFICKLILIPVFIAVFGWNGFFGGQRYQSKEEDSEEE